uniref:Uncharacterized protein n=1 Tax=Acrobeloides nanus TaxID=290746 RepID=A0A914CW72_9BILA
MDRDEFEQIIREIDSLKQIGYHQYIMSLLGWYMYNDVPCLVFDVAQRDLLSFVRSLRDKNTPKGTRGSERASVVHLRTTARSSQPERAPGIDKDRVERSFKQHMNGMTRTGRKLCL